MAEDDKLEMTRAERIFVRISVIQTILAVTGFFVGVIALWAALNEADAVRKQQMASVWPFVYMRSINYGVEGEEKFEVVVGNRGIGPARIQFAEVTIDDAAVQSWSDLVRSVAEDKPFGMSNNRVNGSVLAPGEDMVAFAIEARFSSVELVDAVRELANSGRVNLRICYCSVFDDCWIIDGVSETTTPIDECPRHDRDTYV